MIIPRNKTTIEPCSQKVSTERIDTVLVVVVVVLEKAAAPAVISGYRRKRAGATITIMSR